MKVVMSSTRFGYISGPRHLHSLCLAKRAPTSTHFEHAFSSDGGKTGEVNLDLRRKSAAGYRLISCRSLQT